MSSPKPGWSGATACLRSDWFFDLLEANQAVVLIKTWMPLIREKAISGPVNKTLTIPLWLDKIAKEQNVNDSQILQAALKEQLGIDHPCA